jgi:hypothetical protein
VIADREIMPVKKSSQCDKKKKAGENNQAPIATAR